MRSVSYLAAAVACTLLSVSANAAGKRSVDAHVHGEGELNFAIEGSQVHMELKMPAHDVLGFETIKTSEQKHQLHEALEKLEAPGLWSFTTAASCELVEAHASAGGAEAEHDDHDEHHNKHEGHDDHDEHHSKHEGHDDHDEHHSKHDDHEEHHSKSEGHDEHDHHDEHKGHDHDSEGESGHLDIAATYVFECRTPAKLSSFNTSLFEVFERSESLKVQGFTESDQIASEMSRSQPEVRF